MWMPSQGKSKAIEVGLWSVTRLAGLPRASRGAQQEVLKEPAGLQGPRRAEALSAPKAGGGDQDMPLACWASVQHFDNSWPGGLEKRVQGATFKWLPQSKKMDKTKLSTIFQGQTMRLIQSYAKLSARDTQMQRVAG